MVNIYIYSLIANSFAVHSLKPLSLLDVDELIHGPRSSGEMQPQPLSSKNFFTVPVDDKYGKLEGINNKSNVLGI